MANMSLESEILNRSIVEAVPGQVRTVELEVNNPFDAHRKFEIVIADPDLDKDKVIEKPELVLVDDTDNEWQFWHAKGMASRVDDFGAVDAWKKTVSLEKHAKTKLLFKFQTFRQPIVDHGAPAPGELRPRKIIIRVLEIGAKNSFPIQQMLVMIQPQDLIYDQVFRYYEPKRSESKSTIPNFIPPQDGET